MPRVLHQKATVARLIESGDIGVMSDAKSDVTRFPDKIHAELLAMTERAQVFVVDSDLDISTFQKEQVASFNAMIEAGVAKLPYNTCYFEYTANINKTTLDVHVSILADQTPTKDNPNPGIGIHPIISITKTLPDGTVVFMSKQIPMLMGPYGWLPSNIPFSPKQFVESYEDEFGVPRGTFGKEFGENMVDRNVDLLAEVRQHSAEAAEQVPLAQQLLADVVAQTAYHAVITVMNMVVYLSTSMIPRTRYLANGKVLTNNKVSPKNSYTIVELGKLVNQGYATRTGTNEVTQRQKVRLHLRRGHVRRQRVGAGRKETKVIYIEPILVGYAELGVIEHDYVVKNR